MSDDEHTDGPTNSSESGVLAVATGDRASVVVGAALIGISSFDALRTLAIRASGGFPPDDAFGALLALVVFAFGAALLVDGAAGVVAEKRASA